MRNFVEFAYNGTGFHGSQRQPNGITVQEIMEEAFSTILRARPSSAKGIYLQSWTLSSTMSPGIRLDAKAAAKA